MNHFFEFRSTLRRVRDAAAILANQHGLDSRVTIIGTRHLLIAWHWHPSDRPITDPPCQLCGHAAVRHEAICRQCGYCKRYLRPVPPAVANLANSTT